MAAGPGDRRGAQNPGDAKLPGAVAHHLAVEVPHHARQVRHIHLA